MREIKYEKSFEKDLKRARKKRRNLDELKKVSEILSKDKALPGKYRVHSLKGNWKGFKELHVENDWLLIFDDKKAGVIFFVRLGSHDELFKK